MQAEMAFMQVTQKAKYCCDTGLNAETPSLTTILPALDIIQSCSSDPAHSEYSGVIKQLHLLLMNVILTSLTQQFYAEELHCFFFPSV